MRDEKLALDRQTKGANLNFSCKQFKIENSTPYNIYVNHSSSTTPDTVRYELYVSPNTTFLSPPLESSVFSFYVPDFGDTTKVPIVTFYDSVVNPLANSVTALNSFVSIPPFPITFPSSTILSKTILLSKAQDVYFMLDSELHPSFFFQPLLLKKIDVFGNRQIIGGFSTFDNVIRYTPRTVPETLSIETQYFSTSISQAYTMSVLQTDSILSRSSLSQDTNSSTAQFGTTAHYGVSGEHGFMFALPNNQLSSPCNVNVTLVLTLATNGTGARQLLFNRTIIYAQSMVSAAYPYLIPPRIFLTPRPSFVLLQINNNSAEAFNGNPLIKAV